MHDCTIALHPGSSTWVKQEMACAWTQMQARMHVAAIMPPPALVPNTAKACTMPMPCLCHAGAFMCTFATARCGGFEASGSRGYLRANVTNEGALAAAFTLTLTNCRYMGGCVRRGAGRHIRTFARQLMGGQGSLWAAHSHPYLLLTVHMPALPRVQRQHPACGGPAAVPAARHAHRGGSL